MFKSVRGKNRVAKTDAESFREIVFCDRMVNVHCVNSYIKYNRSEAAAGIPGEEEPPRHLNVEDYYRSTCCLQKCRQGGRRRRASGHTERAGAENPYRVGDRNAEGYGAKYREFYGAECRK